MLIAEKPKTVSITAETHLPSYGAVIALERRKARAWHIIVIPIE